MDLMLIYVPRAGARCLRGSKASRSAGAEASRGFRGRSGGHAPRQCVAEEPLPGGGLSLRSLAGSAPRPFPDETTATSPGKNKINCRRRAAIVGRSLAAGIWVPLTSQQGGGGRELGRLALSHPCA